MFFLLHIAIENALGPSGKGRKPDHLDFTLGLLSESREHYVENIIQLDGLL